MKRPCVLLIVTVMLCLFGVRELHAQSIQDAGKLFTELAPLPDFDMTNHDDPSGLKCSNIGKVLVKASAAEIAGIRPLIEEQLDALGKQAGKRCAVVLLTYLSMRKDGSAVLAPEVPRIGLLMGSDDQYNDGMAIGIVTRLMGQQTEMFVPMLEVELRRMDAPSRAGSAIAGLLLRASQNAPAAVDEVVSYMQRPDLTTEDRTYAALSLSFGESIPAPIIPVLVKYLDSPDDKLRVISIGAISRGGPPAIRIARTRLQELANDNQQTEEVRSAAKEALSH